MRLGNFADGSAQLKPNATVKLILAEDGGNETTLPIPHPEIFAALKPRSSILIDDGKVRLRADTVSKTEIQATVIAAGLVKNHKGINLPDTLLPIPALTPKDRADLDYALGLDVDWMALSFVQRPDDVAELRKIVAGRAGVLSKIEKPAAISALDGILELSDAVKIGRAHV